MKSEILTATVLLACCSAILWHWLGSNDSTTTASQPAQSATSAATTGNRDAGGTMEMAADSDQLIRQAATALANSPPLKARLRYKIDLFGQQISGPGRYFQKGSGSGQSRIEFEFGFNDTKVQLHQFSDGNYLYSLTIAGEQTNLEYVDLRQLDRLQQEGQDAGGVGSPTRVKNWLSIGSLTGLLNQLAEHFQFGPMSQGELDSLPVFQLTGSWKPASLQRLMEGQIDPAVINGTIDWKQMPQQIPHQVQLTLGSDQRFPLFPYQIVFQKFPDNDPKHEPVPIAVLELFELQAAPNLPDATFHLPSTDAQPVDSTDFYRNRIRQFTRGLR